MTKNLYIGIAFLTHPNQCQSQEQNWVLWNHLTRRSKMGKTHRRTWKQRGTTTKKQGVVSCCFLSLGTPFVSLSTAWDRFYKSSNPNKKPLQNNVLTVPKYTQKKHGNWVHFPHTCDSLHGQSAFPVVLVQDVWTHRVPSLETMTTMCNMLNARTTVNESADPFKMVTQSLNFGSRGGMVQVGRGTQLHFRTSPWASALLSPVAVQVWKALDIRQDHPRDSSNYSMGSMSFSWA